jgi:acyl CoA:acetate/3-ketoacid CoA transferase beta subunit
VLEVTPTAGFKLLERAPGVSVAEIRSATAGRLIVEGDIPVMNLS